jgi:hypothetical protein
MAMCGPSLRRAYPVARPGTSAVWSSRNRVPVIPSGAKMRSRANSGSGVPLTRFTITPSRM